METLDDEGSEEEYSDTDDFIVDDQGQPIRDKRKKKKPIFSDAYDYLLIKSNFKNSYKIVQVMLITGRCKRPKTYLE